MPERTEIKPTGRPMRKYRETLDNYGVQGIVHESALRSAFQGLLETAAHERGWTLVPELSAPGAGRHSVRPDGTVLDANGLPRGYWEAKDSADNLDAEIAKKKAKGYPTTNIIYEDTHTAVLIQNGAEVMRADLLKPQELADLLTLFFDYNQPHIEGFERAVEEFRERVPELAKGLAAKIAEAHRTNARFQAAFGQFFELCRGSLNPAMTEAAVDEMLAQHLLTERLIANIFGNPDFVRRNVIAAEVEKVIDALVSKSFDRQEYLKSLDRFYLAIEGAAAGLTDFGEKQHFLNTVYERFFQGYSTKTADTHGIVYTPQPIVDFMCASVEEVLRKEFGKKLGDPDVLVLDPCTGTGNFIVNLLRRVPRQSLGKFYRERLFANEIMLLPYYIAALNIEHAHYELAGGYEPFEGLCFVDTLDLAEHTQRTFAFALERNAERVARQKGAPITVIIGNPPYNVGQESENDQNKNRKYPVIDGRIRETYAKDSAATNKNALADPYVKFFRWATDRLEGRDGIVCFVSNNRFLRGKAFDGFRKNLTDQFLHIYHFDFKGDARTTGEQRRREGGNIFGDQIRVGVGVTLLIRRKKRSAPSVRYHSVSDYLTAEAKQAYLASFKSLSAVEWQALAPDDSHAWLVPANTARFSRLLPLGSKETKSAEKANVEAIFKLYSGGVKTNRDDVVYDFRRPVLVARVKEFIECYNAEVDRFKRSDGKVKPDEFVHYEKIKWSESLKSNLARGHYCEYSDARVRTALYRPFCKMGLFFDSILVERRYLVPGILPDVKTEQENRLICCTNHSQIPFAVQMTNCIPSLEVGGRAGQCFPFYVYDEDGSNRRENVTDWALAKFRSHYGDKKLSKWDIFHYVYGVLHHAGYREKFADCLKRELPRVPLAKDFRAFAEAGRKLAELHLGYEQAEPWKLDFKVAPGKPLSCLVEGKMRLAKDRKSLAVNPTLALAGIPKEAFDYRLGNRSALEWVIDQYQVSEDKATGVVSDPNRPDDPEYIVRLVGQVIWVSVETAKIVKGLPGMGQ